MEQTGQTEQTEQTTGKTPAYPDIVNTNPEPRVYDVNQENKSKKDPVLTRPIIIGDLTLASPTTQTTVGAAGGATAQPATPLGYLLVQVGTLTVAVPYHSAS